MSGDLDDIRAAMRGPYTCSEEVSRWGDLQDLQPCGRTAVALRQDPFEQGRPYPVCAYHARGDMVRLAEIAAALRRFGQVATHET
jgi:hypothetical protein